MQITNAFRTPAPAAQAPVSSERTEKRENDGDSDDGKAAQVAAPKPAPNLNGQVTGQIVNARA